MKFFLIYIVALSEAIGSQLVSAEVSFKVSSMKGVEDIYLRMKRRNPSIRPPQEEKLTAKQELCTAILSSNFFDTHNVEVVDPDHPAIHDQIKRDHRKIHKAHYVSRLPEDASQPIMKFANPYKIHNVLANGNTIPEFMCTCLARNCETESIEQYFISPEYHTDESANVRFVFTRGEKKNDVLVIAMAEKSSDRVTEPRKCSVEKPSSEQATDEEDSSDNSSSW